MSTATPEQHQKAVQAVLDWYHVSGASPDRETISDIVRVALSTVDQPTTEPPTPVTVSLPDRDALIRFFLNHGIRVVTPSGSLVCGCGKPIDPLESARTQIEGLADHLLTFLEANVSVVDDPNEAYWNEVAQEEVERSRAEAPATAHKLLLAFADGLHTMANSLADALNTGDNDPAKN